VDFYAVTGQKWLCGPEGTGTLYVRQAALDRMTPTIVGYFTAKDSTSEGYYLPHPGARRLEVGSRYLPPVVGQVNALARWREEIGPDRAYARIQSLAARLMAGLSAVPGVDVITPPHAHAGLVSIRVDGMAPESLASRLNKDHSILCRSIPWTPWVRFSTGWYNTEEEIDRTVAAVDAAIEQQA
jgi:L-cysteine/cystine lyase